ncbi:hypothetical protein FOBRF1_015189 [Fusarium oxysporum]
MATGDTPKNKNKLYAIYQAFHSRLMIVEACFYQPLLTIASTVEYHKSNAPIYTRTIDSTRSVYFTCESKVEHLIFQCQRLPFAFGLIIGLTFQTITFRNFTPVPGLLNWTCCDCNILATHGVGPVPGVTLKSVSAHV